MRTSSLLHLAPNAEIKSYEEVSRRKQPKSRNGCVTCKTRRMKCDETKPSCQQCSRRGVTCGGYPNFLRWRPLVRRSEDSQLTNERSAVDTQSTKPVQSERQFERVQDGGDMPVQHPIIYSGEHGASGSFGSSPSDISGILSSFNPSQPTRPSREPVESGSIDVSAQRTFGDSAITLFDPQQLAIDDLANSPSDKSPQLVGIDRFISETTLDPTWYQVSQLADLALQATNDAALGTNDDLHWSFYSPEAQLELADAVQEKDVEAMAQMQELDPSIEVSIEALDHFPSSSGPSDGNYFQAIYEQPQSPGDNPEMIRHLFERQICGILCIDDDQSKNPWRNLVWPLSSDCPALYHALAAMTCLHMCRTQPQLRLPGLRHLQCSTQALADNEGNDNMLLEAAIATRLALAFAEFWDHRKLSAGTDHIKGARMLVREAASKHQTSSLTADELSCLSFLANTCLYMDVITRLSCTEPESSNDLEFMTACSLLGSFDRSEQQLDPLMGCAITLFPLIGRLAELAGRVQKRTEKRNSPAIISKAIELRMAIERWAPPIDSDDLVDLHPSMSDSIQTAEAYRWASLLLLRQAVPELPWTHSIGELAQKALVFLATIPLTSRTTIVHIFPLMMAGCEAYDEDDRDWVNERWELMSKRMIRAIVDRCREITAEVWRRRDEFERRHPWSLQSSPSSTGGSARDVSGAYDGSSISRDGIDATSRFGTEAPPRSGSSDFPETAAFRKGIDPLTRAGFLEYTVKGELHWLGVIKDWDWEIMLG